MGKRKKAPELTFQQHIADYLVREHKYAVLEQSDITDTKHFIAEDQLWAFLKTSQADTLKKLVDDYGTDAREEVFLKISWAVRIRQTRYTQTGWAHGTTKGGLETSSAAPAVCLLSC